MSDRFKFRAWDNHEKKWLLGYEYPNLGGFSMFGETMLFNEWADILGRFIVSQKDRKPEDLILMQSTGMKDSNDKLIYEGDILLMHTKNSMSDMEVKFQDGMFVGEGPFNTRPLKSYFDSLDFESIEITGNIYENNQ